MPKATKKTAPPKVNAVEREEQFEDEEDLPDSQQSSVNEEDDVQGKGKKRSFVEEEDGDFGKEMAKVLEVFGADITKTLVAKRKRVEQLAQSSWKNNSKKVEELWKTQQSERNKMTEEFQRQTMSVFQQWDSDLEKTKDQEEKLGNLFRQQQKLFQQCRVVQSQRLKTVRQLHEQFMKGMADLDKCHETQSTSVQSELRKEMNMLQKRILMDTQQREMANVRKSLQTMLF